MEALDSATACVVATTMYLKKYNPSGHHVVFTGSTKLLGSIDHAATRS